MEIPKDFEHMISNIVSKAGEHGSQQKNQFILEVFWKKLKWKQDQSSYITTIAELVS